MCRVLYKPYKSKVIPDNLFLTPHSLIFLYFKQIIGSIENIVKIINEVNI